MPTKLTSVRVADFDFELPEELIAQTPPPVRGSSRMLVVDRRTGELTDDRFASLPSQLQSGDLLVLNDSRVLPARLFATRAGRTQVHSSQPQSSPEGRIEVLLTRQTAPDTWSALVRPGKKVQPGEQLRFADAGGNTLLQAEVLTAGDYGERTLRFEPDLHFLEHLDRIGHMPLPPYIHRSRQEPDSPEDKQRYQTVYSERLLPDQPGSAAAPTAGLHFTPEILAEIEARGVEIARITLHVGLGTFQPVRVETLDEIRLHTELYTLPAAAAEAINRAVAQQRRIVAVGTTTTRTLEHCAEVANGQPLASHSGATGIFLRPGHRFRLVQGLLTNFHLPQSTLLMLVSAFLAPEDDPHLGIKRVLAAYAHAIHERYRFFSYGDCMLIL